jgi:hypothetical protein
VTERVHKNTKRVRLDAAFFADLRSGGYLQSIPPTSGARARGASYFQSGASGNGVRCVEHGAVGRK